MSEGPDIRLNIPLSCRRFVRANAALTAVEFALVMPILLILLLGGVDLVRYINMARQLTYLANSMATMIAERTTSLNGNDVTFAFNSALVAFPEVLNDPARHGAPWNTYLSLTLSSVQFTQTVPGCKFACSLKASVMWSLGTVASRSCTVPPLRTSDNTKPSLITLPKDVFNQGTLIVADVSYPFVPTVGTAILPSVTMTRSIYLQPRYMTTTGVTMTNTGGPYGGCS
jgi:Flp pilus assembly protein TadG